MKEEFVELIEIRLHRTIIFKETLSFKLKKKNQAWLVHPPGVPETFQRVCEVKTIFIIMPTPYLLMSWC